MLAVSIGGGCYICYYCRSSVDKIQHLFHLLIIIPDSGTKIKRKKIERTKYGVCGEVLKPLACLHRGNALEVHRVDGGFSWLN